MIMVRVLMHPAQFTAKDTGELKECNYVYVVDDVKHSYIRIKSVFKNDARSLRYSAEVVKDFNEVLIAAGIQPKKAPETSKK